jgi:hypothetical protein
MQKEQGIIINIIETVLKILKHGFNVLYEFSIKREVEIHATRQYSSSEKF